MHADKFSKRHCFFRIIRPADDDIYVFITLLFLLFFISGGFHNEGSSHKVMFLKDSQWTCLDVSLSPSLNLSIYSCYTPVNLRTSQDWTSDTESESTFEMSSFNELGRIGRSIFLLNMQLFL